VTARFTEIQINKTGALAAISQSSARYVRRLHLRKLAAPTRSKSWLEIAHLGSSFDFIRTDEEIGRDFPRLADLMDHVDSKRAPAGENFRCTRPRA
jgi:hypothetical protein